MGKENQQKKSERSGAKFGAQMIHSMTDLKPEK